MTSSDICAALRERYTQPEWSLFFEVGNGTGGNCRRHADALAMNMYPSRGLSIIGFEIKVSRGDLSRELKNPDKAEAIKIYQDEYNILDKPFVVETTHVKWRAGINEDHEPCVGWWFEYQPTEKRCVEVWAFRFDYPRQSREVTNV